MDVLAKLASVSGKREQDLNIDLAQEIATSEDEKAIKDLLTGLTNKSKAVRHDCIKVLYEIASIAPSLLKSQATSFIGLLGDKDNRMQWGAMTSLSAMATEIPQVLFENLPLILKIADEGSVITRDHGVRILVSLSADKKHAATTIPLLLEQILKSPGNQLPSYAEQALPVINGDNKNHFRRILEARLPEVVPESKRKRVEKVLKKLQ
ncbi:hypothetical protein F0919_04530 [Taibaiella lutea]|uniref:HEAT repeat domain-containing protein n=1 Tax=Taibaiella lutea TaxID=2608001 RepID=A0A5M6CP70_9BACT|nr:sister chromatid cohesion protein PDS5 [Taibaiella lutea]KAA5536944.1 hypothetical protein F0919_04530 [Taibaiella lutea]